MYDNLNACLPFDCSPALSACRTLPFSFSFLLLMIFNRLYATVGKKLNEMTDVLKTFILSVFCIFKLELQTGIICTTVNNSENCDFSWARKVAAINTIFAARMANYCCCYNVHCSLICFLVLSILLMCSFSRKKSLSSQSYIPYLSNLF